MTTRDAAIVRDLSRWFTTNRRDLPWRRTGQDGTRDPYRSLVSEIMLQQTQVSRVVEKFGPFIDRFPTLASLAEADEDQVLAIWSGLGYYRRARGLHRAAREAIERFGCLPTTVDDLQTLPGIGRYTAGAIASIVHEHPAPIVDGNVTRVLLRVEGRDLDPIATPTKSYCWTRAEELAIRAHASRALGVSAGVFNEAMMELGALVCTPRSPSCKRCPVRPHCRAHAEGSQNDIPRPKQTKPKQDLFLVCLRVCDDQGRLLVVQRPKTGLWASLWQPPTLETPKRTPKPTAARHFGLAARSLIAEDTFLWQTTHRSVRFEVYRAPVPQDIGAPHSTRGRWVSPEELDGLALGSPQRRALLGTVQEQA